MDKELVLWWNGQERLRFSVRLDDGSIVETNRRAKPLRVPQGAEIKTVGGDLVGTVDRVTGAGASRYDIHYTAAPAPAPAPKKRRRKKAKPPPEVVEEDDFLAMAERLEAELPDQVGGPHGEAEAL
ncbi:MAG: hypothetical protein GY700_07825 [Propionibacteriaceae bacterium]|nr:hypothetical protein [Propionibacteriaceae bacterium]